jgi:oligopeptide/dipeptide ABC transporter ATP-binding protein
MTEKKCSKSAGLEEPILEVRNLTTKLLIGNTAHRAVDGLSFSLTKGKTLAIVGESGCGKSLTAMSLMRILPSPPALPPEGEVIYKGVNLLTLPEKEMRKVRGSKLAMIFQDPMSALNPVYTIAEQLGEVARWHRNMDDEAGYALALSALKEVGIPSPEERMNDYPHQLSGGMKQRVMIAMALMGEPDILIADEPTTALDVTIQAQVLELMRQLQKSKGMAILLITHDMGVVAEMADEVIVMYAAKAAENGTVLDIFDRMAHPYTRALFHSRAHEGVPKGELAAIKGNVPPLTHFPEGCHFHPRCPHAMPCCKQGQVPAFPLGRDRHQVACWLYDEQLTEKL